mmetsp:Transcript_15214/g.45237  ORF Transcript_15214/g.45237 Transcript_15214/m.45237 type:complete len:216 (+) Transcript_15214:634-1281(+)
MSKSRKFCFSVVRTPFSTKFLARRSRTFLSWYLSLSGFHVSPESSSIHSWIPSVGSVDRMCFMASSRSTSPHVRSDLSLTTTLRVPRLRFRIPVSSSSILPRSPSSINMHPRSPDEIQSFQNDVYPSRSFSPSRSTSSIRVSRPYLPPDSSSPSNRSASAAAAASSGAAAAASASPPLLRRVSAWRCIARPSSFPTNTLSPPRPPPTGFPRGLTL